MRLLLERGVAYFTNQLVKCRVMGEWLLDGVEMELDGVRALTGWCEQD